jgi:hypothetical protein
VKGAKKEQRRSKEGEIGSKGAKKHKEKRSEKKELI